MKGSPRVPVLCYHRVCPPEEWGPDSRSLCVTPERFGSQMRLLKRLGYRAISPQDLAAAALGRKNLPRRSVLLTFDDGYADNYRHAFPILKKYAFTATVFLVTGQIGKTNAWDSGSAPLLNEAQIEEMHLGGIQFGSHTDSHIDLTREAPETILRELEVSRKKLEALTSRLDVSFCYPYARLKPESKELVRRCGYLCAFAGDADPACPDSDLFQVARIQVFPSTSLFGFWKKLQPWYPGWMRLNRYLKKEID